MISIILYCKFGCIIWYGIFKHQQNSQSLHIIRQRFLEHKTVNFMWDYDSSRLYEVLASYKLIHAGHGPCPMGTPTTHRLNENKWARHSHYSYRIQRWSWENGLVKSVKIVATFSIRGYIEGRQGLNSF
jgi:hypothetical protein